MVNGVKNDEDEVALQKGDITIQNAAGEIVSYSTRRNFKISFKFKNNSKQDLYKLGVECAILDKDENVLGSTYAWVFVKTPAGKTAICDSQFEMDDYPTATYIRIDRVLYERKNDSYTHEVDIDEDEMRRLTITIK